ncbi:lysylphosphatidylglycerol synthase transmembrane domain-containing protein [Bremerella sp. JC770]|uniref:lysylphosphatidylglycerol synthase transmembrane domain-containing protein n=1 Tax=Bremerella sp. JC770 TaxID=3232137 RepID=UPI003458446B
MERKLKGVTQPRMFDLNSLLKRIRIFANSRVGFVLKVIIASGLITYLLTSGKLRLETLVEASVSQRLILVYAFTFGALLAPAARWYFLLATQSIHLRFIDVIRITWIGYAASLFLPGAAGGDITRILMVTSKPECGAFRVASTIVMDRMLGLLSLFMLGSVSMLLMGHDSAVPWSFFGLMLLASLAATAIFVLLAFRRSRNLLLKVLPGRISDPLRLCIEGFLRAPGTMMLCFLLSGFSSFLTVGCFWAASGVTGNQVDLLVAWVTVPWIILANSIPLTPNGIGIAEFASSEIFRHFGSTSGAEIMILVRASHILLSLPGVLGILWPAKSAEELEDGGAPCSPVSQPQ